MVSATSSLRYLHTMVRVLDLDRSIAFYKLLGFEEVRRTEVKEGRYTLAFLCLKDDPTHVEIELTFNWDRKEPYIIGDGFGHFAIKVPNIAAAANQVKQHGAQFGGKVTREPGPVKFGTTIIAFVEDPDGYKIELIEKA
ncbi:lactoylglutathione lyase [Acetobacteraceae bacterium]|nr:lactoylglutathione lyase [Acetobacteraceae bacterium]